MADAALDTREADIGAGIVTRTSASVVDAPLGAVARPLSADDVVLLTSDPQDMARVSAPKAITAIRI